MALDVFFLNINLLKCVRLKFLSSGTFKGFHESDEGND